MNHLWKLTYPCFTWYTKSIYIRITDLKVNKFRGNNPDNDITKNMCTPDWRWFKGKNTNKEETISLVLPTTLYPPQNDHFINMSSHALMGRPAARLEKMALMINSYVLVWNVGKRRWLPPYGCNFLIYVIISPCSLDKLLTSNQTLFNVWIHVRTYHISNPTKVSYLVQ